MWEGLLLHSQPEDRVSQSPTVAQHPQKLWGFSEQEFVVSRHLGAGSVLVAGFLIYLALSGVTFSGCWACFIQYSVFG